MKKLLTPRLIISTSIALLAFLFTYLNPIYEHDSNTTAQIKEAEAEIESAFKNPEKKYQTTLKADPDWLRENQARIGALLQREQSGRLSSQMQRAIDTIRSSGNFPPRLDGGSLPEPEQASAAKIEVLLELERSGHLPPKMREELDLLRSKRIVLPATDYDAFLDAPEWNKLEAIWKSLSYSNSRIAMAKAMLHFENNPSEHDSDIWKDRYKISNEPWVIEEKTQLILKTLGYSFLIAFGAFAAVFSILWVLSWGWGFLLARVREISRAVKGQ